MFHLWSLVSSLIRWFLVVSLCDAPVLMEYGDNEHLGQYLGLADNMLIVEWSVTVESGDINVL